MNQKLKTAAVIEVVCAECNEHIRTDSTVLFLSIKKSSRPNNAIPKITLMLRIKKGKLSESTYL